MKRFSISFVLLFSFLTLLAQEDSTEKKHRTLKLNVHYSSNSVYLGRKDSLAVSYITPGLTYVAPSGFFTSFCTSYLLQDKKIDLFSLEAGYSFSAGDLDADFSATSFLYNAESVNITSEISASASASLSYYTSVVTPGISAVVGLTSSKPDYSGTFSLEKEIETSNKKFIITPAFYINAGTQNYYDSYYKNRRYGKGRKNKTATISGQALNASTFKIMDYELTANLKYKIKNFSFYFEPTYAIPVNPDKLLITVTGQNGAKYSQQQTEKISNSFYFSIGTSYKLDLGKKEKQKRVHQ